MWYALTDESKNFLSSKTQMLYVVPKYNLDGIHKVSEKQTKHTRIGNLLNTILQIQANIPT